MEKENTIEGYFNLAELNDVGDTHHSGSWSKDHLDPTNTWGNGMCFVYYNRNCSFKLKQEIWQKLGCADIWDESKLELHTMLLEAMNKIEELEKRLL